MENIPKSLVKIEKGKNSFFPSRNEYQFENGAPLDKKVGKRVYCLQTSGLELRRFPRNVDNSDDCFLIVCEPSPSALLPTFCHLIRGRFRFAYRFRGLRAQRFTYVFQNKHRPCLTRTREPTI